VEPKVPKLRTLPFETAIFERHRRRESSVEEALVEMYLAGVSVRRVEDITAALWGIRVSPSTLSELNERIYGQVPAWRERPIEGEHAYVYLDGIWLKRSWGGEVQNVAVPVGVCVDRDGFRQVLGVMEGAKEDQERWAAFLRHLKGRGLRGVRLFVSDKCLGLVETLGDFYPEAAWQRCVVYLKRDFQKLVDGGGPAARLGRELQGLATRVLAEWHLFRGGVIDREALQERLASEGWEPERLLRSNRRCADQKAATFCANLPELLPAVWRFVITEGVEPTNNHAERLLRRRVLWRKNAYGSSSASGCRFVERMLTVVQTRRFHGRPVLRYLYAALVAHRNGLPAPSLLSSQ
jgi:hypothetical protein